MAQLDLDAGLRPQAQRHAHIRLAVAYPPRNIAQRCGFQVKVDARVLLAKP
ncbi:hypothetical protein D3C80_2200330 [compost metagenome]